MIHALTSDEAFERAERKGRSEGDGKDEGYTYNGRPAVWVFAGIRKLNECLEYFDPEQQMAGGMEENGTEVTYSSFILDSEASLRRLVSDEDVPLLYESNRGESVSEAV